MSERATWDSAFSLAAQQEGWDLFDTGHGMEIQRDDEAAVFASDDAAVEHVQKLALAGSSLHKLALEAHAGSTGLILDGVVDVLLDQLHDRAHDYDPYEFGLPSSPEARRDMREIVRAWVKQVRG